MSETQKKELEVYYGLPPEVKFCKICCITNQRPNSKNEYAHTHDTKNTAIDFNEEGICAACRNKEKQHKNIDWKKRHEELVELCNRYRRESGAHSEYQR